jgi:hypothetical protein
MNSSDAAFLAYPFAFLGAFPFLDAAFLAYPSALAFLAAFLAFLACPSVAAASSTSTVTASAFVSGASAVTASAAAASLRPGSVAGASLEMESYLVPSFAEASYLALVGASLVNPLAFPFALAYLVTFLVAVPISFCGPSAVARPSSYADFSASSFAAAPEWLAC